MPMLLQPLNVGSLSLFNRLVLPPMATAKALPDGAVSPELIAYYDEKTLGGYISLAIIEHSFISPDGKASDNQLSVADDSVIGPLGELAEVIHRNGSRAIVQINHAGSNARDVAEGRVLVGPSGVIHPRRGNIPRELSQQEISEIVAAFAAAALRVKKAGFDGVEIHSAHGYLLNQFYSPLTNHRRDDYGGDVHNRIRIHLEVIAAVRAAVGAEFPVLLRLGAADHMLGGNTGEDSRVAAVAFEKAGITILDISGGMSSYYALPGMAEEGYFAPLSRAMKEVITIPVILTGGIISAVTAERLLQERAADLIGVGRAILADSAWAKQAIEQLRAGG